MPALRTSGTSRVKPLYWRPDGLAEVELAYLKPRLAQLTKGAAATGIVVDQTMVVRCALSALVKHLDAINAIEDPEEREMKQLLLGSQLRGAAHGRRSKVPMADLEAHPGATWAELDKLVADRARAACRAWGRTSDQQSEASQGDDRDYVQEPTDHD